MKKIFVMFTLALLSLTSCQEIIDNYWDRKAEESYVSPYKGVYVGTYIGSDQGTIRIEVSSKDWVDVTRISNTPSFSDAFSGGMSGASFNQVRSRTSGFTVMGNLIKDPQNTYSGTWKIDDGNVGTWTLKKE